jgi:hypothetical protein
MKLRFAHAALERVRAILPERTTIRQDALAGLPGAVASVPGGMAASVLVGVSPVHGLYAGSLDEAGDAVAEQGQRKEEHDCGRHPHRVSDEPVTDHYERPSRWFWSDEQHHNSRGERK